MRSLRCSSWQDRSRRRGTLAPRAKAAASHPRPTSSLCPHETSVLQRHGTALRLYSASAAALGSCARATRTGRQARRQACHAMPWRVAGTWTQRLDGARAGPGRAMPRGVSLAWPLESVHGHGAAAGTAGHAAPAHPRARSASCALVRNAIRRTAGPQHGRGVTGVLSSAGCHCRVGHACSCVKRARAWTPPVARATKACACRVRTGPALRRAAVHSARRGPAPG
jgi:hypothetical protein